MLAFGGKKTQFIYKTFSADAIRCGTGRERECMVGNGDSSNVGYPSLAEDLVS